MPAPIRIVVLLLCAGLLVVGCGDESGKSDDAINLDTISDSADGTIDLPDGSDVPPDGADVPPDVPVDIGPDAIDIPPPDIAPDIAPDVPPDMGPIPGQPGDPCMTPTDCASNMCVVDNMGQMVCSECSTPPECGLQQTCVVTPSGYGICQGTGMLGENCTGNDVCAPGSFCNGGVCSMCSASSDCNGGLCVDDSMNSGYWICAGEYGDRCNSAMDCGSGFCLDSGNGQMVCSECDDNTDCAMTQVCTYDAGTGWGICVGNGMLGDTCQARADCVQGLFCNNNYCSECGSDMDCGANNACADDTAGAGYYRCLADLGENCTGGSACASGFCYARQFGGGVCSNCETNVDCGGNTCDYGFGDPYARCVGTGVLGTMCMTGGDCASGFCAGNVCSECEGNVDCGNGGVCEDQTMTVGHFVCLGSYGEPCMAPSDCGSGFCVSNGFFNTCGECAMDMDCGPNQTCESAGFGTQYTHCEGSAGLGDMCMVNGDCQSGTCTAGICTAGLNSRCSANDQCTSGFCYLGGMNWQQVCSECSTSMDCAMGMCSFSFQNQHAICQ